MVNKQDPDNFPVIIIGGGLAGLIAGAHLAVRGIQPLIIEADSRWPGGRLSGGEPEMFTHFGKEWAFVPDHGVHAIWGNYLNLRASLDRFMDIDLYASTGEEWANRWKREVRAIEAGTIVRNSIIPAPFHYLSLLMMPHFWRSIMPWDFISLPGYLFSTLWAVGFDPLKEQSALDGMMMREFFRGWTPNLRATFQGLGKNLLAAPESDITLSGFIAALRFYTILRRDAWDVQFLPGNSNDSLIEPLIRVIKTAGGECMLGATAVEIKNDDTGLRVIFEDTATSGRRALHTDHIIMAMSAPAARQLLISSHYTRKHANRLIFPDGLRNVVIRLWFDVHPRPGTSGGMFTGDFVPDNFFWLHRIYEEFAEWRQAGGSAIELHFYGGDALLDLPDANLLIIAVNEVQRAFPDLKGHFVHGATRRNSRVHTRFRVPTSESLHVNTPWPDIYAAGDWIGYDTPSLWMERSTVTGIAAANAVISKYGGEVFPILQPPSPGILVWVLASVIRVIRRIFTPIISVARRLRHR